MDTAVSHDSTPGGERKDIVSSETDLSLNSGTVVRALTGGVGLPSGISDSLGSTAAVEWPPTEDVKALDAPLEFGRYTVDPSVRSIKGGQGTIHCADDYVLERKVAIKVVRSKHGRFLQAQLDAIRHEYRVLARLPHPNIVPIFDAGQYDAPGQGLVDYFVMPWIDGLPFRTWILSHALGGPGPGVEQTEAGHERVLRALSQVASAVHFAHERGYVHRDLKPDNIMITAADEPRILDFGLAYSLLDPQPGGVSGTRRYMAPEQTLSGVVSPRTDVWALGVILYEALSGRPPFTGQSALSPNKARAAPGTPAEDPDSLFAAIRSGTHPPLPPHVHRDLSAICERCLQVDPDSRYPSAAKFAEDLERWLNRKELEARRRAEEEIRRQTALAQNVAAFLTEALSTADPHLGGDPEMRMRDFLRSAEARIAARFRGQPDQEAAIRKTVSDAYYSMWLFEDAAAQRHIAAELMRACAEQTGDAAHWRAHIDALHGMAFAIVAQARTMPPSAQRELNVVKKLGIRAARWVAQVYPPAREWFFQKLRLLAEHSSMVKKTKTCMAATREARRLAAVHLPADDPLRIRVERECAMLCEYERLIPDILWKEALLAAGLGSNDEPYIEELTLNMSRIARDGIGDHIELQAFRDGFDLIERKWREGDAEGAFQGSRPFFEPFLEQLDWAWVMPHSFMNYARVYCARGRFELAEALGHIAVRLAKTIHVRNPVKQSEVNELFSAMLLRLGQSESSENYLRSSTAILRGDIARQLGDLAARLEATAAALSKSGRKNNAEHYLSAARSLRREVEGLTPKRLESMPAEK